MSSTVGLSNRQPSPPLLSRVPSFGTTNSLRRIHGHLSISVTIGMAMIQRIVGREASSSPLTRRLHLHSINCVSHNQLAIRQREVLGLAITWRDCGLEAWLWWTREGCYLFPRYSADAAYSSISLSFG